MPDPHVLFLLNPGRQSRHYILGLVAAARRLGITHCSLEMGPIWERLQSGPDQGERVQREVAKLVHRKRITHAIGYAWNGALDFGFVRGAGGASEPLLPALGVRHVLLWTDHPNWFRDGAALQPRPARFLAHPFFVHLLKSEGAAHETRSVLGWPRVHSIAMAEDYDALRRPPNAAEPIHDAVAIVGATHGLPAEAAARLADQDPDPAALDQALLPPTAEHLHTWGLTQGADLRGFAFALLAAKAAHPCETLFALAARLGAEHGAALEWLRATPSRWFAATAILRQMVDWRRNFYLAWLARRLNLGIYGASAAPIGVPQPPGADAWVEYSDQAAVYARGRFAININAAHDEQGCTHKPFQIAAAGVACAHHQSTGLDRLLGPSEVAAFSRAAELLEALRAPGWRERGRALLDCARRDHTWDLRLEQMLRLASDASETGTGPRGPERPPATVRSEPKPLPAPAPVLLEVAMTRERNGPPTLARSILTALHGCDPYEGFAYADYPLDLQGGGEQSLMRQAFNAIKPRLIVEVGSWKGASAVAWASMLKEAGVDGAVICVDTWLGGLDHITRPKGKDWQIRPYFKHGYSQLYYQFLANVCQKGLQDYIVPLPNTSVTGARWLAQAGLTADLVYVDASHEEDDVYQDLEAYWRVLRPGGMMCGDDWALAWHGVVCAVNRFARERDLKLQLAPPTWLLQKTLSAETQMIVSAVRQEIATMTSQIRGASPAPAPV